MLGDEHPRTLITINNLATLLNTQGNGFGSRCPVADRGNAENMCGHRFVSVRSLTPVLRRVGTGAFEPKCDNRGLFSRNYGVKLSHIAVETCAA